MTATTPKGPSKEAISKELDAIQRIFRYDCFVKVVTIYYLLTGDDKARNQKIKEQLRKKKKVEVMPEKCMTEEEKNNALAIKNKKQTQEKARTIKSEKEKMEALKKYGLNLIVEDLIETFKKSPDAYIIKELEKREQKLNTMLEEY